jgi:signal transduction histidine kinase
VGTKSPGLEEFLGSVLRGAAKLLGCNSTNLILINDKTREIRIHLGTTAASYPIVAEIEQAMGRRIPSVAFPISSARDSMVFEAWRDRALRETSSLFELVGSALSSSMLDHMSRLIGEHRYICVPAVSGSRSFGILLFEKEGRHPFSRQQREVLLGYARRIGEILENDLKGHGWALQASTASAGPEHLILDATGEVVGVETGAKGEPLVARLAVAGELELLRARARVFLCGVGTEEIGAEEGEAARPASPVEGEGRVGRPGDPLGASAARAPRISLRAMELLGRRCALCTVEWPSRAASSLENQLLELTLGDAAPSLFLDPELRITSCNEAAAELLGRPSAELALRPVAELFREPTRILDLLGNQVLDPESPYCEERAVLVGAAGTLVPARVEALLLANDHRHVVGFLLLLREEKTDEAQRVVAQARLATMGEMAAQLAHEIRNPLLAIGATLESLSRGLVDPAEQSALLGSASREIVRMDMILKDHLAAARQEMVFEEVPVREVVEAARGLLEGARHLDGKRIEVRVDPGLVVRADFEAMKHVFFNLLLNSLEASPPEGLVVCAAEGEARDVAVSIEDEGQGLAANPEECFRPFFTTKKNGTGLGLAVCRKIVEAHGGLVSLEARPGGGCRAAVLLPRPRARGADAPTGPRRGS